MTPITPMGRTVAGLSVLARIAADRFVEAHPRRSQRAGDWNRRRAAYAAGARLFGGMCGSGAAVMGPHCEALTLAAQHRAQAWFALAEGRAADAAHHRRASHKARAMSPSLTPAVWRP